MENKKIILIIASIIIVAILLLYLPMKQTKQLENKEIEEYQGEKLDSINSFRDNSIKGVQNIDIKDYTLRITGLVDEEKSYTYDEVLEKQSYSKVVTLHCVEGWSTKILWEGVLVKDLLKDVKISGNANTIIFHASDGYTTSFPIEYFEKDILLAYKMNNETIIPERGFPFQLVAEDKWGYKWIKWITEIEISDDENYEGYWESRGYSNKGNLNENFLGK